MINYVEYLNIPLQLELEMETLFHCEMGVTFVDGGLASTWGLLCHYQFQKVVS